MALNYSSDVNKNVDDGLKVVVATTKTIMAAANQETSLRFTYLCMIKQT